MSNTFDDVVGRLETRARIRILSPDRKSLKEDKPDRLALLLLEAASEIKSLRNQVRELEEEVSDLSYYLPGI